MNARDYDDCRLHRLPPRRKPPDEWVICLVFALLGAALYAAWLRGVL